MSSELPRTVKIATLWLLAGLAVFLAVEWSQQRAAATRFSTAGETVRLRRGADGHYHWPGRVNGRAVEFLVDTGATRTALPASLAAELGLASRGRVRSATANGVVTGDEVRADIALDGGVRAERLVVVALPLAGGHPLLGMDLLGRLRWQQRDGLLEITPNADRGPAEP